MLLYCLLANTNVSNNNWLNKKLSKAKTITKPNLFGLQLHIFTCSLTSLQSIALLQWIHSTVSPLYSSYCKIKSGINVRALDKTAVLSDILFTSIIKFITYNLIILFLVADCDFIIFFGGGVHIITETIHPILPQAPNPIKMNGHFGAVVCDLFTVITLGMRNLERVTACSVISIIPSR